MSHPDFKEPNLVRFSLELDIYKPQKPKQEEGQER